MEEPSSQSHLPHLAEASKRLARQTLVIVENRLELLLVELQEERERIFHALWLGLATAVFSLLAAVTVSIAIAVAFWNWSPLGVLLILAAVYAALAAVAGRQLAALRRDWRTLSATLDELRKDRACLDKNPR